MPKILIVEDEQPNVEILSRLLAMNAFDVVVAGNKKDALHLNTSNNDSQQFHSKIRQMIRQIVLINKVVRL